MSIIFTSCQKCSNNVLFTNYYCIHCDETDNYNNLYNQLVKEHKNILSISNIFKCKHSTTACQMQDNQFCIECDYYNRPRELFNQLKKECQSRLIIATSIGNVDYAQDYFMSKVMNI